MTVESAIIAGKEQIEVLQTKLDSIKAAIEGIDCGGGTSDIAQLWADLQAHWATIETGLTVYGVAGEPTTWELENLNVRNTMFAQGDIEGQEARVDGVIATNYLTSLGTGIINGYLEVDGETRFQDGPLMKTPPLVHLPGGASWGKSIAVDTTTGADKSLLVVLYSDLPNKWLASEATIDVRIYDPKDGGLSTPNCIYSKSIAVSRSIDAGLTRLGSTQNPTTFESIPGWAITSSWVDTLSTFNDHSFAHILFYGEVLNTSNVPDALEGKISVSIKGETENLKVGWAWGLPKTGNVLADLTEIIDLSYG